MARPLSAEWFARVSTPEPAVNDVRLRIHQVVTGGPDGDIEYGVLVVDDGAVITLTPPVPADVRIATDHATAVAVHGGALTVGDALAAGRLRVTGDTARLVGAGDALARAETAVAGLRGRVAGP